jgi:repressor LexA
LKNICSFFNVTTDYILGVTSQRIPLNSESEDLDINDSVKIPVLGVVTAGMPIYAEENILSYEYVDKNEVKNGDYFYLKVKGDSMINARIMDGDLVFIRKQREVVNGEIAVVLINNEEATLKRVLKTKDTVILQPENPKYVPMVFNKRDVENQNIQVLGKVVHVKFLL